MSLESDITLTYGGTLAVKKMQSYFLNMDPDVTKLYENALSDVHDMTTDAFRLVMNAIANGTPQFGKFEYVLKKCMQHKMESNIGPDHDYTRIEFEFVNQVSDPDSCSAYVAVPVYVLVDRNYKTPLFSHEEGGPYLSEFPLIYEWPEPDGSSN